MGPAPEVPGQGDRPVRVRAGGHHGTPPPIRSQVPVFRVAHVRQGPRAGLRTLEERPRPSRSPRQGPRSQRRGHLRGHTKRHGARHDSPRRRLVRDRAHDPRRYLRAAASQRIEAKVALCVLHQARGCCRHRGDQGIERTGERKRHPARRRDVLHTESHGIGRRRLWHGSAVRRRTRTGKPDQQGVRRHRRVPSRLPRVDQLQRERQFQRPQSIPRPK